MQFSAPGAEQPTHIGSHSPTKTAQRGPLYFSSAQEHTPYGLIIVFKFALQFRQSKKVGPVQESQTS